MRWGFFSVKAVIVFKMPQKMPLLNNMGLYIFLLSIYFHFYFHLIFLQIMTADQREAIEIFVHIQPCMTETKLRLQQGNLETFSIQTFRITVVYILVQIVLIHMDWFPTIIREMTAVPRHLVAMFLTRKRKSKKSFSRATDALFEHQLKIKVNY